MASGRPDWYGSMTLHGRYTLAGVDSYKSIAVDEEGNLITLMTGLLEGVYTPIAVDDEGIMRANIVLQDLVPFTVRETYGAPKIWQSVETIDPGPPVVLKTINAKGRLYAGFWYVNEGESHKNDVTLLRMDGMILNTLPVKSLYSYGLWKPGLHPLYCSTYNDHDYKYLVGITPHVTFETQVIMSYENKDPLNQCIVTHGILWSEIT